MEKRRLRILRANKNILLKRSEEGIKRGARAGIFTAVCLFAGKIIGAAYKLPLINILGAEGMGAYQLVFPVFAAAIALTSGSAGIIISRNVAARRADPEIKDGCGACFFYTLLFSLGAAAFLCVFAGAIAKIQGFYEIKSCYYIIAPAVVFVGMSSCFKGVFNGGEEWRFSAVCQLAEQVVRAVFGLSLAYYFGRFSLIKGVMGAVAGVTAAEFFSLIVCFLHHLRGREKYPLKIRAEREFFKRNKFITAQYLIMPLNALADGLIIVKLLTFYGYKNASSLYGIYGGSVNTLINMPVVVALSAAVTIVPAVSYALASRSVIDIKERTRECVKYVLFITCACFFGMFLLAEEAVDILFSSFSAQMREETVFLLRFSCVNMMTASLSGVFTAVIQALEEGNFCLKTSLFAGAGRIALMCALLPFLSIDGAAISWVLYYAVTALSGYLHCRKLLGSDIEMIKNNGKILFGGVIMFLCLFAVKYGVKNLYVRTAVCISLGAAVYFAFCLLTGAIKIRRKNYYSPRRIWHKRGE